jgi:hypothetical protein
MSEKRYQVFVSSTFRDLKDERGQVMKTLMDMGCIPASMELFPAMDEEVFEFIKTVIDDCDYYLLIIANLYGSLAPDGISYTEKEYDYAVSKGIKVVALIHEKPETLPFDRSEETAEARARLTTFRAKVKNSRIVKFWTKPEELPGLVAINIQHAIRRYPAVGWVRADKVENTTLLTELNEMRKQNEVLKSRLDKARSTSLLKRLARLDETVTLQLIVMDVFNKRSIWAWKPTWGELFWAIGPYLFGQRTDEWVKDTIQNYGFTRINEHVQQVVLNEQDCQTVKVQFMALNLIALSPGTSTALWSLTRTGKRRLTEIRSIRKSANSPTPEGPASEHFIEGPAE